ncbi:hypothetical protein [Methanoculleus sp.]|uniref:hypothetical protein n=1 Tax=Methanoculleus sp. TaxID=90427 RepID=UPI001BD428A3|nr:hypothetical protein [Methanoculleus sp.]
MAREEGRTSKSTKTAHSRAKHHESITVRGNHREGVAMNPRTAGLLRRRMERRRGRVTEGVGITVRTPITERHRGQGLEGVVVATKPSKFGFISLEDWNSIEEGNIKSLEDVRKSVKKIRVTD